MNYCPKCGTQLASGQVRCPSCGFELRTGASDRYAAAQPRTSRANRSSGDHMLPIIVGAVGGLLVAVLLIFVFLIPGKSSKAADTADNSGAYSESYHQTAALPGENSSTTVSAGEAAEPAPAAAAPAAEASVSGASYYVTGVANLINMYNRADTTSAVAGKLANYDAVKLLDDSEGVYWQVETQDGLTGYIDSRYLTEDATAVVAPRDMYISTAGEYAVLADTDRADYMEVGRLYNGETVTVLSEPAGTQWYVYSGKLNAYGYVDKAALTRVRPTDAPASTPEPVREVIVVQGQNSGNTAGGYPMMVYRTDYYLALRSAKAYDSANEIGELHNGELVQVLDNTTGTYWYVYAPTLDKYGYVNSEFLTTPSGTSAGRTRSSYPMTVYRTDYYLALRSAKEYDSANEIGELHNGETVQVMDDTTGTYWYVYAPTLGKYGYVNSEFLTSAGGAVTSSRSSRGGYTMYVYRTDYYLALRSAKSYDEANEIGELYNGEAVQVVDDTTGDYWYVYAPTLGKYGYVNSDFLTFAGGGRTSSRGGYSMTVYGTDYYLALRSAKSYDEANEIGELHNGETVQVMDDTTGDYWYVYAPTLGKYGYVNSDFLR